MVNRKSAARSARNSASIEAEIAELRRMTAVALRAKYRELFGEDSRSGNRQFLFRRVAWRLQALAEGDLSERARQRALDLANDADLRIQPVKGFLDRTASAVSRDPRLPEPGMTLRRAFKGQTIEVKVFDDEFEYEGRRYRSLSAIASKISGSRWNGFAFFGLTGAERVTSALA